METKLPLDPTPSGPIPPDIVPAEGGHGGTGGGTGSSPGANGARPRTNERIVLGGNGDGGKLKTREHKTRAKLQMGALARLVTYPMRRVFTRAEYPARAAAEIRQAAENGIVVYVSGIAAPPNFILLHQKHADESLPVARFVGGVSSWLWPRGPRLKPQAGVAPPPEDYDPKQKVLYQTVAAGKSAHVFLRFGGPTFGFSMLDWFSPLVALQRQLDRPIYLVPETLVWSRRPGHEGFSLTDLLLGERDDPGFLRSLASFARPLNPPIIAVGEPIDLRQVIGEHAGDSDLVIASYARKQASRSLLNLQQSIVGPIRRSSARVRELVFEDPAFRKKLEGIVQEDTTALQKTTPGVPVDPLAERKALARAGELLREISATMRFAYIDMFGRVLDRVWNRIYDGLHIDAEGLEEVRKATRESAVVLCPSHKSHLDYLILSYLFYRNNIMPPHIASGINLSFWPMGHIFRNSGAFFLRRSFKGDKLYSLVFRSYIKRLLRERFPIQFFPEGTRSRTGKLLHPKTGMLAMCVEAYMDSARDGQSPDVAFVPISVCYEKIVESGSYSREQGGGQKKSENLGDLLSARSVLRSRYGRVYVEFGKPISLQQAMADEGFDIDHHSDAEYRHFIKSLAYQIVNEINLATLVTPTALVSTVLLTCRTRGLEFRQIVERATWILRFVQATVPEARISTTLEQPVLAIREALELLREGGLLERKVFRDETLYAVVEEGRVELNYYKNNLMQFLVSPALIALALLSFKTPTVKREHLRDRSEWVSRLFKFEFVYRTEGEFDDLFNHHVGDLLAQNLMFEAGGRIAINRAALPWLKRLAFTLREFLEGYWVFVESMPRMMARPLTQTEFTLEALQTSERAYYNGEVLLKEAAAKSILDNARQLMIEQGFLEEREQIVELTGGKTKKERLTAAGPLLAVPGAYEELRDMLRAFLDVEEGPAAREFEMSMHDGWPNGSEPE
jgi:glycerol-3-phosphate O-acyltransferase